MQFFKYLILILFINLAKYFLLVSVQYEELENITLFSLHYICKSHPLRCYCGIGTLLA